MSSIFCLCHKGGLGLLPLHAAWNKVNGQRRYLLDDYTITYVPSLYALHVSQQRLTMNNATCIPCSRLLIPRKIYLTRQRKVNKLLVYSVKQKRQSYSELKQLTRQ